MKRMVLMAVAAMAFNVLSADATVYAAGQGGQKGKSVFEKMDRDGNGKVTSAEQKAYREGQFKSMDADRNGKLTGEEFLANKGDIFDEMDADRNGVVTIQEYVGYWCGKVPKSVKSKKTRAAKKSKFKATDKNRDGKIDDKECVAYSETIFIYADADDNGKITREEFLARMKKVFSYMDLDKDGVITVEEYNLYWVGRDGK